MAKTTNKKSGKNRYSYLLKRIEFDRSTEKTTGLKLGYFRFEYEKGYFLWMHYRLRGVLAKGLEFAEYTVSLYGKGDTLLATEKLYKFYDDEGDLKSDKLWFDIDEIGIKPNDIRKIVITATCEEKLPDDIVIDVVFEHEPQPPQRFRHAEEEDAFFDDWFYLEN